MKRTVILFTLLVPLFLFAQDTPLSALFDKYVEVPGFSTTEIKTSEVSFEWEQEEGTEQIREVLDGIESIRIINMDEESQDMKISPDKFYSRIKKAIGQEDYVEVITVSDGDEDVNLYFLRDGEMLREAALVVHEKNDVSLITITGNMDPSMLMRKETIKGLNSLKNFYVEKKDIEVETEN
jgi:hypothetical protein